MISAHGARKPTPNSYAVLEQYHGAYGEPARSDTAFWHRDARYQIVIGAAWDDPADQERCIRWAREFYADLEPHGIQGQFLNFNVLEDRDRNERVRTSFGGNYDRLVDVKNRYNPGNPFRINNNIRPTV